MMEEPDVDIAPPAIQAVAMLDRKVKPQTNDLQILMPAPLVVKGAVTEPIGRQDGGKESTRQLE